MHEIGYLSSFLSNKVLEECMMLLDDAFIGEVCLNIEQKHVILGNSGGVNQKLMAYYDNYGLHIVAEQAYLEYRKEIEGLEKCRDNTPDLDNAKMYQDFIDIETKAFFKTSEKVARYLILDQQNELNKEMFELCNYQISEEECLYMGVEPELIELEKEDAFIESEPIVEQVIIEEKPVQEIKYVTSADIIRIYLQLYGIDLIPQKKIFADVQQVVLSFFKDKGIDVRVDVNDNDYIFHSMCEQYLHLYYIQDFVSLRKMFFLPTSVMFMTSSIEKYKRLLDIMSGTDIVLFRMDYPHAEVQGDFMYVALAKMKKVKDYFRNCLIEDTSLLLAALQYNCGSYIKEFMLMGSVNFANLFMGSKTLWISVLVMKKNFDIFVSVVGVEGKICPVNGTKYGFDVVNSIYGTEVSFSSLSKYEKEAKSAGVLSAIALKNMVYHSDQDVGYCNGFFKDRDVVKSFRLNYEFYGDDPEVSQAFYSVVEKYIRKE
jgi:inosine/xanthosine triphosphate pyrophosphatase family protein